MKWSGDANWRTLQDGTHRYRKNLLAVLVRSFRDNLDLLFNARKSVEKLVMDDHINFLKCWSPLFFCRFWLTTSHQLWCYFWFWAFGVCYIILVILPFRGLGSYPRYAFERFFFFIGAHVSIVWMYFSKSQIERSLRKMARNGWWATSLVRRSHPSLTCMTLSSVEDAEGFPKAVYRLLTCIILHTASQGEGLPGAVLYAYFHAVWARSTTSGWSRTPVMDDLTLRRNPSSPHRFLALIFEIKAVASHSTRKRETIAQDSWTHK